MWIGLAIVVFLLAALVGLAVLLLSTAGRVLAEVRRTNEQIAEQLRHRDAVAEVLASRLQTVGAGLAAEIQAAAAHARARMPGEPIAGWPPRSRRASPATSRSDVSTLTDDDVTPPSGYTLGASPDRGDT